MTFSTQGLNLGLTQNLKGQQVLDRNLSSRDSLLEGRSILLKVDVSHIFRMKIRLSRGEK